MEHMKVAVDVHPFPVVAAVDVPELPEVETVRCELEPLLTGRKLRFAWSGEKALRRPVPHDLGERLKQWTVTELGRRGKYLLIYFTSDLANRKVLLLHLGMSGRLRFTEHRPQLQRHDHLLLGFALPSTKVAQTGDSGWVVLNDPRRFGSVELVGEHRLGEHPGLSVLGPEPLSRNFTAEVLALQLKRRPKSSIKCALLDARVVAGIGNIYACEILYRARIHPRCSIESLLPRQIELLAEAIPQVLKAAISAGGSSWRDYVRPSGLAGSFQQQFAVYGRQGRPCPECTAPGCTGIVREVQAQRSTFYCPERQILANP